MFNYAEKESSIIDIVLYLQGYKEGWKDGEFQEKFDYRDCIDPPRYRRPIGDDHYHGWFWDFDQMRARNLKCLSVQGSTDVLLNHILEMNLQTVMIARAENLLHHFFGNVEYWSSRRSMRFSKRLTNVANEF